MGQITESNNLNTLRANDIWRDTLISAMEENENTSNNGRRNNKRTGREAREDIENQRPVASRVLREISTRNVRPDAVHRNGRISHAMSHSHVIHAPSVAEFAIYAERFRILENDKGKPRHNTSDGIVVMEYQDGTIVDADTGIRVPHLNPPFLPPSMPNATFDVGTSVATPYSPSARDNPVTPVRSEVLPSSGPYERDIRRNSLSVSETPAMPIDFPGVSNRRQMHTRTGPSPAEVITERFRKLKLVKGQPRSDTFCGMQVLIYPDGTIVHELSGLEIMHLSTNECNEVQPAVEIESATTNSSGVAPLSATEGKAMPKS